MEQSPGVGRRRARWSQWRRGVQVVVAATFVVVPVMNHVGFNQIGGTLSSLQIGSLELMDPTCALSLVAASYEASLRIVIAVMPLVAATVVLGPVLCSWICPYGLVSEVISSLRVHLRRSRHGAGDVALSPPSKRIRSVVLLAGTAASAAAAFPILALFSAPRAITALPIEIIIAGTVGSVTGGVLGALLVIEVFAPPRTWCRHVCPAGTLQSWLRVRWTLHPRCEAEKCARRRGSACARACPWGIHVGDMRPSDGCTNCMRCIDACSRVRLAMGGSTMTSRPQG